MRLIAAVLALALGFPAAAADGDPPAAPPAPEVAPAPVAARPAAVPGLRARADALRAAGDYPEALAAYEAERAAGGDTADVWKHIGWTQKALRNFAAAAAALERALQLDPGDREAADDLANLKRARGLELGAWVGGTEPGTSKAAYEGQLTYSGWNRLSATAGASYTDNIFYTVYRGFAEGSWFYTDDSYLRGAFSYRSYAYTSANGSTPDSSAYRDVPRPEVEVSHWIARRIRVGLDYQLFLPNFEHDPSTHVVNHKLAGEVEVKLGGGLSASGMAALLRDPDPNRTFIKGRPKPGSPPGTTCPNAGDPNCATETVVVERSELLVGGGLAYESRSWGASVRYIPNRDLDSGFAWSVVSSLDLRPHDRLSFNLAWVLDRYATAAGPLFAGKDGNIWWGTAQVRLSDGLAVAAGLKWVKNPGPASTATNPAARNDGTLLVQLHYQTGAF